MLAIMLSVVDVFPDYQFVIAGIQAKSIHLQFITNSNIKFISQTKFWL
jgi:lipid-A-disaccharide synthase